MQQLATQGSATTCESQQLTVKSPTVIAHNYDTIGDLLIDQTNTTISEHTESPKQVCTLVICLGSSKQK